ncbi:MAG: hypothetical protein SF052_03185 [Bacteroidia bacterium]|nr:hypothetical protein [Bacteroidia bacterium]
MNKLHSRKFLLLILFQVISTWSIYGQSFKKEAVKFTQWLPPAYGPMDELRTYQCVVEHARGANYRFPVSEDNMFPAIRNLTNLVRVREKADIEMRVYLGRFQLLDLEEKSLMDDGERLHFYKVSTIYPATYEIIHLPTGRILYFREIKEREVEEYTTFSFDTKAGLKKYWEEKQEVVLRDLEILAISDIYRYIHNLNEQFFEYERSSRNYNFAYVNNSKDYEYPEFDNGLSLIQQAAPVLTDSISGLTDQGRYLVRQAIDAWDPLIREYVPNTEARITEKVYREANYNIALAHLMICDYEGAMVYFRKAEGLSGGALRNFGTEFRLEMVFDRLKAYSSWDGQVRAAPQLSIAEMAEKGVPDLQPLDPPPSIVEKDKVLARLLLLFPIKIGSLRAPAINDAHQPLFVAPFEVFPVNPELPCTIHVQVGPQNPYPKAILLPPSGVGLGGRESFSRLLYDYMGDQVCLGMMDWERSKYLESWYNQALPSNSPTQDQLYDWMTKNGVRYGITAHVDEALIMPLRDKSGANLGYDLILKGKYMLIDVNNRCLQSIEFSRTEEQIINAIGSSMLPGDLVNLADESQKDTAIAMLQKNQSLTAKSVIATTLPQLNTLVYQAVSIQLPVLGIFQDQQKIALDVGTLKKFDGFQQSHKAELIAISSSGEQRVMTGKLVFDTVPPTAEFKPDKDINEEILSLQSPETSFWVRSIWPQ